uniref:BZIP domain-containing protein n=1 Tax=Electrophorus electricus TaxID=8005 RepID=A0A4W4F3K2_ELEEL
MDTILDNFASDKLFPNSNLLDLEDLNETDFLTNHFSEQMEDFSNELFSSFFDDHLLAERPALLDVELEPPNPDIQQEHSYSLSGDSAPQSPSMPIKSDEDAGEGLQQSHAYRQTGLYTQADALIQHPTLSGPFYLLSFIEHLQLPPTPPSSHSSDSDGSQSPHSLPPSSPARSSVAISSSPLLTAPHKLQGTSGPLLLTEEEKRTLMAEGYPVPNKLPLTKTEEKALKRVRRKIKNKISAQESRRKKKEYVECLEKKVENYTSENNELWKKVETLESANSAWVLFLESECVDVTAASLVPCRVVRHRRSSSSIYTLVREWLGSLEPMDHMGVLVR